MTKDQNSMILEDFLLDEDINYEKQNNGYIFHVLMEKTKLPHAVMHMICSENIIHFSIYPGNYVIPADKIDEVAQYFRIVNAFSAWGGFELANEQMLISDEDVPAASIFPAFKLSCDTIDSPPSKDRIRCIFNILASSYTHFIDGVLMIQHDILTPLQAAKAFLERK